MLRHSTCSETYTPYENKTNLIDQNQVRIEIVGSPTPTSHVTGVERCERMIIGQGLGQVAHWHTGMVAKSKKHSGKYLTKYKLHGSLVAVAWGH